MTESFVKLAATAAGVAAISLYLNGKYHICKDLTHIYYLQRGIRHQDRLRRENRIDIWRTFTENAAKLPDLDCVWYQEPGRNATTVHKYTWAAAHTRACQYAHWFLSNGVRPGDCVAFILQNSADFVLAWLGLIAISCYPAMINYNLVGGALVHCVKIAECKIVLVDDDIKERVLNNEHLLMLGVQIEVLDDTLKARVATMQTTSPGEEHRRGCDDQTKLALRYTRLEFSI